MIPIVKINSLLVQSVVLQKCEKHKVKVYTMLKSIILYVETSTLATIFKNEGRAPHAPPGAPELYHPDLQPRRVCCLDDKDQPIIPPTTQKVV